MERSGSDGEVSEAAGRKVAAIVPLRTIYDLVTSMYTQLYTHI